MPPLGETVDVPTLILLGAAGGLLRGALDLYTRFVSWQADRRSHRQSTAAGTAQEKAPRFQAYFDPSVDIVAAVVHSLMGAGAAVLFGTTGQISGEYAALVVGLSAPMLLTQLSRIQTVSEAVTGDRQPAGVEEAAAGAGVPAAARAGGGSIDTVTLGVTAAEVPVVRPPRPAPSASPASSVQRPLRPMPSLGPNAAVADSRAPDTAPGALSTDRTQLPDGMRLGDTRFPPDAADGTGSGVDGLGAPRWRQGPAIREEGP